MDTRDIHAEVVAALERRGKTRHAKDLLYFCCPRHEDKNPSAWLGEWRWGCHACGFEERLDTLCDTVGIDPPKWGFTVEDYADLKGFSVADLRRWGVETVKGPKGGDVVAIPYHDAEGKILRRKFRWEGGTWWEGKNLPTHLYGLSMLAKTPKAMPVILVEGESDCHAAWSHKKLAVGVPGSGGWKGEWAPLLAGRKVFVWQEPGDAGEKFAAKVTHDIPHALVVQANGVKDIANLHKTAGVGFSDRLEEILGKAKPFQKQAIRDEAAEASLTVDEMLRACGLMLLGKDATPDEIETALRTLQTRFLGGADKLRRASVREAVRKVLKEIGVSSPIKFIDAVLASAPNDPASGETEVPPPEAELLETAKAILGTPDQLALVSKQVTDFGYAGDTEAVELLNLAFTSRLLNRPINVQVEGASASGKSFTVDTAQRFHPPNAVHDLTAMSERALAYSDSDFRHRFVRIGEAAALFQDGIGATIIRELAWGNGIRYEVVVKVDDKFCTQVIEKPGPTGFITTATKGLDPEISTRLLRIHITDSPEQTRAVLKALAQKMTDPVPEPDLSAWHAAQRWLEHYGNREIVVPFARDLADNVPVDDVRMRRDFEQILTVMQVHAFCHQQTRKVDGQGRIIADRRDYEAAYRLLTNVLAITLGSVTKETRETVKAVSDLWAEKTAPVSYPQLADRLGLSRSGAWRRAKLALDDGYLVNEEERQYHPAKLALGDPLPLARAVLPAPDDLFSAHSQGPPPKPTHRLNTPQESPAKTGERGVERSVEPSEVLTQHSEAVNTSRTARLPRFDGRKSGSVEPVRANQGGTADTPPEAVWQAREYMIGRPDCTRDDVIRHLGLGVALTIANAAIDTLAESEERFARLRRETGHDAEDDYESEERRAIQAEGDTA